MKTAEELEKEFIETVKEKTNRTLDDWLGILKNQSFQKMKETVDWLKKDQGLIHSHATFLAGIYLNDGKPVHDSRALFNAHFAGKEDKLEIYQTLEKVVKDNFAAVQIVPTKGYISFRNKKEFAVAKINKNEIRVGLDLQNIEFNDYVVKAKSLGTMPRISHMIEVREKGEINDHLKKYLVKANQLVNE
ncbi:DUF5655 domain-containing protein [Fulvivirgaceae bacterium BMA10]|uniref:DUF5655 domain-containing protein n=1 Tax=Splendidivirga corallicola TaxID=3051826 RepID=A0ABT8KL71_9BACT|nr:DUF5655 domain-containing protein [Fulvivirgaceae bacterium BMA10]